MTAAAEDFEVRWLGQLASLAPRSYSYAARWRQDTARRAALEQVALECPRYGYRRMTAPLRRRDGPVNRKRVLRRMREDSLLVQVRWLVRTSISRPGLGHGPNRLREIKAAYPNPVWVADITSVRVQEAFLLLSILEEVSARKGVHSSWGYQTPAELEAAYDRGGKAGSGKDAGSAGCQPKKKTPRKNRRRQGGSW